MPSTSSNPEIPKVQQVLHVYAKSILSCTFGRSAASSRTGVAPPPSYQSVTVNGVTTLLHLNSRDGLVHTVGSIDWDEASAQEGGKRVHNHRVTVGEHTSGFSDVLRVGRGLSKDLKFRSDTRAIHLPGQDTAALTFQRVAIPSGGFPFTVYTIYDSSMAPGPTPAHSCVGQLTVRDLRKPNSGNKLDPARFRFFGGSDPSNKKDSNMVIRLEVRTRDKPLIDNIVFGSLLIIAGKHPIEADSRVEADRLLSANESGWDAPPALSNLATPMLSPNPSAEHLPLNDTSSAAPQYRDDSSQDRLLPLPDDPFSQELPVAGPSTAGPSRSAVAA